MVREDIRLEEITPRFPYPSGPREYQQQAFENWKTTSRKVCLPWPQERVRQSPR